MWIDHHDAHRTGGENGENVPLARLYPVLALSLGQGFVPRSPATWPANAGDLQPIQVDTNVPVG